MNIQPRPLKDGRPAWRCEFRAAPDPATGKPRRIIETCRGTRRDAERYWVRRQAEIDAQGASFVQPAKDTLGEYLERWLADYVDQHCKPSTAASYRVLVRAHIKPALGAVPLRDLTAAQVAAWVADMARKTVPKGSEDDRTHVPISPRRVAYARAVLRAALHEAVRLRMIPSNPVDLVRAPKQAPKQIQAFTLHEAQALDAAAEGHRLAVLVRTAWRTGIRLGEILALQWSDVDFEAGTILVHRNIVEVEGKRIVQEAPKTEKGRRTVAMTATVAVDLQAHRTRLEEERRAAGEAWQDGGWVFCTQEGKPLAARNVERLFYSFRDGAGLPAYGFHSLRHTWATLAKRAGVDIAEIADALGHESPAFTAKVYAHVLPEGRREMADRFEAFTARRSETPQTHHSPTEKEEVLQ